MGTKLNTFFLNREQRIPFHRCESQQRIMFSKALTGYMVANNSKMLCTINKSMRPEIASRNERKERSCVGGEYITSLFCSILKYRLMLSINRTINPLSAEIIDGLQRYYRWRHWHDLWVVMQFCFRRKMLLMLNVA